MLFKKMLMTKYVIDELSRMLGDDAELSVFVHKLKHTELRKMCKMLSGYRYNGVYKNLVQRGGWKIKCVGTDKIKVGGINSEIEPTIKECDYNLNHIVEFGDMRRFGELNKQRDIRPGVFITVKEDGIYRVIDGTHRIIILANEGTNKFMLAYTDKKKSIFEQIKTIIRMWCYDRKI